MERRRIEVLAYIETAFILEACGIPSIAGITLGLHPSTRIITKNYFIDIEFSVSSFDRFGRPAHPLSNQTENSNR